MSSTVKTGGKVVQLRPEKSPAGAAPAVSAHWHAPAGGLPNAGMSRAPSVSAASIASQARAARRRRGWLIETLVVAGIHAINGLFIALYAVTGTVPWTVGASYACIGVFFTAVIAAFIASGRTIDLKDPSLAKAHLIGASVLCVSFSAAYPRIASSFALILFTLALSSTFRVSKRHMFIGIAVVGAIFVAVTIGRGHHIQIPNASRGEQFVAWLFFAVTLGRCVMLSLINVANNKSLARRSQQMTEKLAQIERLAHHDELTGVLNRRQLLSVLSQEIARAERSQTPLAAAIVDLDHFKAVNDTLGHLAGDQVLKRFAGAMNEHTRNTDRFGRYGGEEFLMIFNEASTEQAELAITRIRAALAGLEWADISPQLKVTFSAGIALHVKGGSVEQLLARADQALYQAKSAGRNCTRAA